MRIVLEPRGIEDKHTKVMGMSKVCKRKMVGPRGFHGKHHSVRSSIPGDPGQKRPESRRRMRKLAVQGLAITEFARFESKFRDVDSNKKGHEKLQNKGDATPQLV